MPQAHFVGEAGYGYQGEADIDGGGNLQVNRFDVGGIGRLDLPEHLRWDNTLFFSVNDYDFGGSGFSTGDPWDTILTLRMVDAAPLRDRRPLGHLRRRRLHVLAGDRRELGRQFHRRWPASASISGTARYSRSASAWRC